tara:strand:- start:118 stop:2886 length:2769 start_codon:yes stop_codon:yes gene_type:complete
LNPNDVDIFGYEEGGPVGQMKRRRDPDRDNDPLITPAQLSYLAAQFAPGTGLLDASGRMAAMPRDEVGIIDAFGGEYMPSIGENIAEGEYFDAAMQGLGVLGDAMYAVPFVGPVTGVTLGSTFKGIGQAGRGAKRGIESLFQEDTKRVVDEIVPKGAQLDDEGNVTLYHRTTPEAAKKIVETGEMTGKEDRLFFGTRPDGQISGYGDAVVEVKIPADKIEVDDIFDNEAHVTLKAGFKPQKVNVISSSEGVKAPDARLTRAGEQGFDTEKIYYHATDKLQEGKDFDAFVPSKKGKLGPGIYLSPDSEYTERYIRTVFESGVPEPFFDEGARILPVFARGKIADAGDYDKAMKKADGLLKEQFSQIDSAAQKNEFDKLIANRQKFALQKEKAKDILSDEGFSGFQIQKELVIFDPKDIRSVNAQFAEGTEESADLLAKGIGSLAPSRPPSFAEQAMPATRKDAPPQLIAAERQNLSRFFTKPEIQKMGNVKSAAAFSALMKSLPNAKEMATIAEAGSAKRGWYQASADALVDVFGDDAPRFTGVLAGTSPQTSVQSNLLNSLNIFKNWNASGRPGDPRLADMMSKPGVAGALRLRDTKNNRISENQARKIFKQKAAELGISDSDGLFDLGRFQLEIIGESVEGEKGVDSILEAWVPNTMRALNIPDKEMDKLILSGPKVDSFMRNLAGNTIEVTNDTWMANYMGIPQTAFSGSLNPSKTDPGKGPGYLAANVLTRNAADVLSNRLGEKVTGPEIQEMVWSWAKAVVESSRSQGMRPIDFVKEGKLTDSLVNDTPDFSSLLNDPDLPYKKILDETGKQVTKPSVKRDLSGNKTQEIMSKSETLRRDVERAAKRLQRIKADKTALGVLTPLIGVAILEIDKGQPSQVGEVKMEAAQGGSVSMLAPPGMIKSLDQVDIFTNSLMRS